MNLNKHQEPGFLSSEARDRKKLNPDIVCFSHLRWDFVFQRPQHLLSRFAKDRRLIYFEEPIFENNITDYLKSSFDEKHNVTVLTPFLNGRNNAGEHNSSQQNLLKEFLQSNNISDYLFWYYTPMALKFTEEFNPKAIVYDCMDELSAFKNAPAELISLEKELMRKADIVFTGGRSLYEHKQTLHNNIHCFPSSIEKDHFEQAKYITKEPEDQKNISHPRIGFYGVIDERFDVELLRSIAMRKPQWQFVILGPVVKIDEADLPRSSNIHYLGGKKYDELPGYLAGWDAAMMPFAKNESTRFISPTKTPEFLAAGKPVVSTSIRDVVRPYSEMNLVHIADEPQTFVKALEYAFTQNDDDEWKQKVSEFLQTNSWDITQDKMNKLLCEVLLSKNNNKIEALPQENA